MPLHSSDIQKIKYMLSGEVHPDINNFFSLGINFLTKNVILGKSVFQSGNYFPMN